MHGERRAGTGPRARMRTLSSDFVITDVNVTAAKEYNKAEAMMDNLLRISNDEEVEKNDYDKGFNPLTDVRDNDDGSCKGCA
jgi:hypothetical protein